MARITILHPDAQAATRRLTRLLAETGSMAALVRTLNEALDAAGSTARLHQNRLGALLSDDPGRGINEATFALVTAALAALPEPEAPSSAFDRLSEEAQTLLRVEKLDLDQIATRLDLPRGVARVALEDAINTTASTAPAISLQPSASPDWSHQDTAVARVLDAFRRRPRGRIGLVLPTGAGKTRIALRIILERLAQSASNAKVIWVTHRKALKRQAFQQLGKLLTSGKDLPVDADKLANRIVFTMVNDADRQIDLTGDALVLVVVDEAHHAAAPSYASLLSGTTKCPILLLTATPNRPDLLPIGIDEIAFTITYRELAERHVIQIPTFEPFAVDDFDWSPRALTDLSVWLADETANRFRKVLILAPQVSRVLEFYNAFLEALRNVPDHPLVADDVGYIHGQGNSLGLADEDFLERFEDKPRAVLVSAQMLLEGYDDPSVDTVVLTYPTSSVIRLMQAAGRAVRYHPGKTGSYVIQADNADLHYRFDQRWLYQELSDYLRPEIIDKTYATPSDRKTVIEAVLRAHNVGEDEVRSALQEVDSLSPSDEVRLLLTGRPYYGPVDRFGTEGQWGVFVETPSNRNVFRQVFNAFSAAGALLSDPTDFLTQQASVFGFEKDLRPRALWRQLTAILTASHLAREEVYGNPSFGLQGNRPKAGRGPTTWLKYITFTFQPKIPDRLSAFLSDCHNRTTIEAAYLDAPEAHIVAVKVPLPLAGAEALLLTREAFDRFDMYLQDLRQILRLTPPSDRFAALAAHLAVGTAPPLPQQFLTRIEHFIDDTQSANLLYLL